MACFSLVLAPTLALGQSVPAGGEWQPGSGAVGDNTLQGFIDQPQAGASIPVGAPFHVSGWVVDTSAEGWAGVDGVQVLQGDRVLATGNVGGNRPDVANVTGNGYWAKSGFDAVVPGNALGGGPATLTVAAHTPGRGTWTKQININVTGTAPGAPQTGLVLNVLLPQPGGEVIGNKNGTIYGVAYDTRTRAELGTGVDRVQAYLDGPRGTAGSQFVGEATLTGAANWSIPWEPTRFNHVPHHFLWIYARSSVTGEEKVQQVEINITQH